MNLWNSTCDQARNKYCFKLKEVWLNQSVKYKIIGGKKFFLQNCQNLFVLNYKKKVYNDLLRFLEFCIFFR